jgi:DNA-binding HxlR family transcriptional regulator
MVTENPLRFDVYNPACPTRRVLHTIADKWTPLVVGALADGTKRFSAIRRILGGVSQKMLTQTLRGLERDGIVERRVFAEVPPRVEYSLTPLGRTLIEPLAAIRTWAETHIQDVEAAQTAYDERETAAD